MLQIAMFDFRQLTPKPGPGIDYTIDTLPVHLKTAAEWRQEGCIIEADDARAWLWDDQWVALYSKDDVVIDPKLTIIHVPAIEEDIARVKRQLAQLDADLADNCRFRMDALKRHRQAPPKERRLTARYLSFIVGLDIQQKKERKALKKELVKLETLLEKNTKIE